MARWQNDAVDFACEAWAWQWIQAFAAAPIRAGAFLGRVGSTLDLQRLLTGSIGSNVSQAFPEVFLGDGLVVACTLKTMSDRQRELIWRHYVDRWFYARVVPVRTQAGRLVYEHTKAVPFKHPVTEKTDTHVSVVDRDQPVTRLVIEKRLRPVKQEVVALRMGIKKARYYELRDIAKRRLAEVIDPQTQKLVTRAG